MTAFSTSRPKSRARLFCKSQSSGTRHLVCCSMAATLSSEHWIRDPGHGFTIKSDLPLL